MNWILGVRWASNGPYLKLLNRELGEHTKPVRELQSQLSFAQSNAKVRGRTSFAHWRRLTEPEVLSLAKEQGFSGSVAGQTFYAFESDGQRQVIPAGVLMCAMFRPLIGIARYVFAPQGLDNLCQPYGDREKPDILFFTNPRMATGMQADKAEGIINSLSWMHCFPSARRMWGSALNHARAGQLDLTLPNGDIQYYGSGTGLRSGDTLIHQFHIRLLETDEEPFEQFSRHTKVIEFERILHKLDTSRQKRTGTKDATIPLRHGDWTITDSEWSIIRDDVLRKRSRGTEGNLRRILNLQLEKLSQGLSWSAVAADSSEQSVCRKYLNRMTADGRWEFLIGKLAELRRGT